MLLLNWAVRISIVLLAGFVAARLLRRQSAAVRHSVWTAAIVSAVLLPLFGLIVPAWQPDLPSGAAAMLSATAPAGSTQARGVLNTVQVDATASSPVWRASGIFFMIWAAGCTTLLLIFIAGAVRLASFTRRAKPFVHPRWNETLAELSSVLGVRRSVKLLQDAKTSMLITWGTLRPRILLPANAENWPEDRIRAVLGHELAHIRRGDWIVQVLAELARAIYWFNPLMWISSSRLRQESERACDDAVLNLGFKPSEYAEHLLDLARSLKDSKRAWSPALAMARPSNLERRFTAMLNPSLNRSGVSRSAIILTALVTLSVVLPLSALQSPAAGRLAGGVYDPSGAPIPNAVAILWSEADKTRIMTTTNAVGVFDFVEVPAGPLKLQVHAMGFASSAPEAIDIRLGSSAQRTINLNATPPGVLIRSGERGQRGGQLADAPPPPPPPPPPQGAASGGGAQLTGVIGGVRTAGGDMPPPPPPPPVPQRIRQGGRVQQYQLIHQTHPVYPEAAKAAGIEGVVILEGVIGHDGSVLLLKVVSSVHPDLSKAAVDAVSQWKYKPTLLNGQPVEVVSTITVTFKPQ